MEPLAELGHRNWDAPSAVDWDGLLAAVTAAQALPADFLILEGPTHSPPFPQLIWAQSEACQASSSSTTSGCGPSATGPGSSPSPLASASGGGGRGATTPPMSPATLRPGPSPHPPSPGQSPALCRRSFGRLPKSTPALPGGWRAWSFWTGRRRSRPASAASPL